MPDPIIDQIIPDPKIQSESQLFNVSIRGWIAVMLVFTVCVQSIFRIPVNEPLYTLVVMAVSFYLGSKTSK